MYNPHLGEAAFSQITFWLISLGRFEPVQDLFDHAKDLFVEPNRLTPTGQHYPK
jgi:hypothetical protein